MLGNESICMGMPWLSVSIVNITRAQILIFITPCRTWTTMPGIMNMVVGAGFCTFLRNLSYSQLRQHWIEHMAWHAKPYKWNPIWFRTQWTLWVRWNVFIIISKWERISWNTKSWRITSSVHSWIYLRHERLFSFRAFNEEEWSSVSVQQNSDIFCDLFC